MKVFDQRSVPEERLATTDESGKRVFIFPADVKGVFRRYRTITQTILIVILLILPWIKIGGEQAVLLNILERKFSIFGLTFWAHDGPLIFFILAMFTIGLAFVTAFWGRVWCGWACPQTVFIDGVFRRIEQLVIGSNVKRKMLAQSPTNAKKIIKLSVLWFLFLIVSLIITHSFLAYFVGAEKLVGMTIHNPSENWTIFVIMAFLTTLILFDFGWFREQFCIIMCPYGRFQSVLIDDDSVNIAYDEKRGEPRRGTAPQGENEGDCIDCYKCVAVCPTGIDIRRGLQMECVACTACIDACDEVMEKIGKPKQLIKYASENQLNGIKTKYFSARRMVYSVLLIAITSLLVISIYNREDLDITILRAQGTPFKTVEDEEFGEKIINHFKTHLKNHTFDDKNMSIALPEKMKNEGIEIITQNNNFILEAGSGYKFHFFLKFPPGLVKKSGNRIVEVQFLDLVGKQTILREVKLVGPKSI